MFLVTVQIPWLTWMVYVMVSLTHALSPFSHEQNDIMASSNMFSYTTHPYCQTSSKHVQYIPSFCRKCMAPSLHVSQSTARTSHAIEANASAQVHPHLPPPSFMPDAWTASNNPIYSPQRHLVHHYSPSSLLLPLPLIHQPEHHLTPWTRSAPYPSPHSSPA